MKLIQFHTHTHIQSMPMSQTRLNFDSKIKRWHTRNKKVMSRVCAFEIVFSIRNYFKSKQLFHAPSLLHLQKIYRFSSFIKTRNILLTEVHLWSNVKRANQTYRCCSQEKFMDSPHSFYCFKPEDHVIKIQFLLHRNIHSVFITETYRLIL
jgi:hypothetical protein